MQSEECSRCEELGLWMAAVELMEPTWGEEVDGRSQPAGNSATEAKASR